MSLSWDKAKYGGTDSKKGGGKLESPMSGGNKGIPKGTSAPKAQVGRKSGIDTPMTSGNKGVTLQGGQHVSKAPLD